MEHDKQTNPKDIVFNYSDIELTEGMTSVLNLGLNYSILPFKLDISPCETSEGLKGLLSGRSNGMAMEMI